ncbi:amidohydrolase 3 [Dendrothele bispora CBS 962.96]|uniref:Amidohydrolase 3 n=1 Tax=Dendrothele bispora (strain CBS 962.96) TaxID=1314807 RepID=A0A4S8M0V9_DENBC|nr:amidohydrolase 3 [Dendrothele bispora CBS 962.96]
MTAATLQYYQEDILHNLKTPSSYVLCSPNGTQSVYTVDINNSRKECLLVVNDQILAVGTQDFVKVRWHDGPRIVYIPMESIVVPGLSDSHAHIMEYGENRQLPLEGTLTVAETVSRVRNYSVSNPDIHSDKSLVVRGGGWDHTSWPNGSLPTSDELESDPVLKGRLIILQSKDYHALWVSPRMLEMCGDLPETVEGGVVVRDEHGKPTGVFLDNAQELVNRAAPSLTEQELVSRFTFTVNTALSYGLTTIHDAGLDPSSLEFFERLVNIQVIITILPLIQCHIVADLTRQITRSRLPIRIYAMKHFEENMTYWGNLTKPYSGIAGSRLGAGSVKIFADGALRTGGAALHHHYHDNPSTTGFMRLSEKVLFDVIPQFLYDGWQVNVHAIGDRANNIVLDAFEAALDGANVTALRPRLEHAQILTTEDMERLGRLGVIASIQPTHAISDMLYAEGRLGPERVKGLYAFRSIISKGGKITLGTDFPVEDMNPFKTFYAAITREATEGGSPHGDGGWFPEQCLTREETLRGMTIDPAYASFAETILGSLEPGKKADFVVLSQNIMDEKAVPARKILQTKVLATVIDGEVVYGNL